MSEMLSLKQSPSSDGYDGASSSASPRSNDAPRTNQRSRTTEISSRVTSARSEDDEEIRIAKAMALTFKNNPSLSPEEIRNLAGDSRPPTKKPELSESITHVISAPHEKRKPTVKQNFKNLAESVRMTREKAKERLQGIVGNKEEAATPTKPSHGISIKPVKPLQVLRDRSAAGERSRGVNNGDKFHAPVSPIKGTDSSRLSRRQLMPGIKQNPSKDEDEESRYSGGGKAILSGVVWKRRSGLGKLSVIKAWERRRVVLRGRLLEYYKTDSEIKEEKEAANLVEGTDRTEGTTIHEPTRKQSWLEQAAMNLEKAKANLNNNIAAFSAVDDPSAPRGVMDLIKERATVAAASGHSGAPSPFAISVKVKGETKWKFCFKSHAMQMEWLAALTNVVVAGSVDHYNAQLLGAADPAHEASLFHNHHQVMQPPSTGDDEGHKLWMLDDYIIKSSTVRGGAKEETVPSPKKASDEQEHSKSRDLDISIDAANSIIPTTTPATVSPMADSENQSAWTLKGADLFVAGVVFNAAVIFSRASSAIPEGFWYVFAFTNVIFWVFLVKDEKKPTKVVGASQPSPLQEASEKVDNTSRAVATRTDTTNAVVKKTVVKNKAPKRKPRAGTTTIKLENPEDPPKKDNHTFGGWRAPPCGWLMVRSYGYLNSKVKIPSPGALYDCVNCDMFESQKRCPDMASRVQLPKVNFDDGGAPKTWHSPDIFIVSVALPTESPQFGRTSDDGAGYTITMYFAMKQETRDILRRVTADDYDPSKEKTADPQKSRVNAVKLFEEWCRRAPNDPKFQARFKLVPNAQNLKEIGVPGWISKYNGKPFLIKRAGQTGFIHCHPELSCIEFDISIHPFPYLARQGLCYLEEHFFPKILGTFGFVIEGRSDDELPECLIGLIQLCYPDFTRAIQAKDFFAGSSPESF